MGLTIKLYFSTKRCRADQVVKKTGPSRRSMPSRPGSESNRNLQSVAQSPGPSTWPQLFADADHGLVQYGMVAAAWFTELTRFVHNHGDGR
jgi:hypothetical protein